MSEDRMTKEEFLANRKTAGQEIDVETCDVWDKHCQILDPYGVDRLSDECDCIGRVIFVRSAESDGPVCVYDLPKDKAIALYARIERGDVEPKDDFLFKKNGSDSRDRTTNKLQVRAPRRTPHKFQLA